MNGYLTGGSVAATRVCWLIVNEVIVVNGIKESVN